MVRKISRRGHIVGSSSKTGHKISNAKAFLPLDDQQLLDFKPDLSAADLGRINQMEHRHKIRPVQLFVPSSSNPNTLRLNKSALNAVLGHSSIANRKILGQHVFCRIDAANGERIAVLLMDTQGCFEQSGTVSQPSSSARDVASQLKSSNANSSAVALNNTNYSVLALSTMLSSIQLYNVAESIADESLQALSFFTDYNRLHSQEASAFGKPFQKFVIVVRDFKVSEQMIYGIDGGTKLLEKALRQNNNTSDVVGGSPAEKALKEIKKEIRQCFDAGFSCYLLPNPGPKITDQSSSFKGLAKEIKALFRDEVRRVVEAMIGPNLAKPKVVNGKEITVRKFVECVREYAKIFEAPELPFPRSVLNANLQLSCVDYAMEAKIAYCRGMDRVTRSSRMMAEKKLLEAHIKQGIKALNIYDKCPKVESGDVRSTNLARLQESINHELERYKRANEEKRVTTCASAMLACGDSALFGLGLGGAASGAVAASVVTLQMGIVSAGIVAIPVSLGALFGIWAYVTLKPTLRVCLGMERDS